MFFQVISIFSGQIFYQFPSKPKIKRMHNTPQGVYLDIKEKGGTYRWHWVIGGAVLDMSTVTVFMDRFVGVSPISLQHYSEWWQAPIHADTGFLRSQSVHNTWGHVLKGTWRLKYMWPVQRIWVLGVWIWIQGSWYILKADYLGYPKPF